MLHGGAASPFHSAASGGRIRRSSVSRVHGPSSLERLNQRRLTSPLQTYPRPSTGSSSGHRPSPVRTPRTGGTRPPSARGGSGPARRSSRWRRLLPRPTCGCAGVECAANGGKGGKGARRDRGEAREKREMTSGGSGGGLAGDERPVAVLSAARVLFQGHSKEARRERRASGADCCPAAARRQLRSFWPLPSISHFSPTSFIHPHPQHTRRGW